MPSSWTQNFYHLVFATKRREPWLTEPLEARLYAFLGGIARDLQCTALAINGHIDHVHMLVRYPADLSHSDLARHVKARSSKWIHETFVGLADCAWQEGYGGFTVSKSMVEATVAYIQRQREHHRSRSFQEEFMHLLERHGILASADEVFGPYRPPSGRE
ncbi:MAG: hypothetical protein GIKADHBN_01250 [Phycisphaerales bacterium]|nr:hypothetical protein [Phycisphaerales bacterium]